MLYYVSEGGEKVLLHFIQDTPGDFVPLEDITRALGISSNVQAGVKPQVNIFIHIIKSYFMSRFFKFYFSLIYVCVLVQR